MRLVVTDASHGLESEEMIIIISEMTSGEGHRSQGARMVFLTDGAWACNLFGGYVAPPYRQRPTHFKQVWKTVTC